MSLNDCRQKLALLERWNHTCIVCGHEFTNLACVTFEHIVPRSKGGGRGSNLAPSHYSCNRLKGTKSLLSASKQVTKKLSGLIYFQGEKRAFQWLNKPVPNRAVHPAAMLDPVDAWWFVR